LYFENSEVDIENAKVFDMTNSLINAYRSSLKLKNIEAISIHSVDFKKHKEE